ncbi:MAG: hypothetical protein R3A10_09115 [Caldilineaceae bacterium]
MKTRVWIILAVVVAMMLAACAPAAAPSGASGCKKAKPRPRLRRW